MYHDDTAPLDVDALPIRVPILKRLVYSLLLTDAPEDAAEIVARHGHPLFGANATLVYLLDASRQNLDVLAGTWQGDEPQGGRRRLAIDLDEPLSTAVRKDEVVYLPERALVAFPMRADDEVIGGVLFRFDTPEQVRALRHNVCVAVVAMCGLAIARRGTPVAA